MILGITGPTGSGKTTALRVLRERGFLILDCDQVYRELLASSPELLRAIEEAFPGSVKDGELDRGFLRKAVFSSEEELNRLNRVTHPFVLRETDRRIAQGREAGVTRFAIDAIALFEGGEAARCDLTVAVTAPRDKRAERIMVRDGISREAACLRIDAQKPAEWFTSRCDRVLENDFDSGEAFAAYAARFFDSIIKGDITMAENKRDVLFYEKKHVADQIGPEEKAAAQTYCEGYKAYLAKAKTERLAVKEAIRLAEEAGFSAWNGTAPLTPGAKIYRSIRGKSLYLAVIGERPMEEGTRICAAHVDSPRIDLKQVPLYENDDVAYFKTHYYGGIRKYQWVTIPLALHGVVVKKDGTSVEVSVGEEAEDPTFVISDLLPHLGAKQGQQPLNQAITGENLNPIVGTVPYDEEEKGKDRVKLHVLALLNEKYGITEEDFLSAELEIVPALPVKDVGFDRSLIAGYGHDDRVCAYAELAAILEVEKPAYTAVCILADKEEIGSVGVTGMQSRAFENFMEDLCRQDGSVLRHAFDHSLCLSADVTNAFDPLYPEVSEKRNNTRLNGGLGVCKYTGSRGKGGASDASAEVVGHVRKLFAEHGVLWQTGEIGKVDEGGGGTVAAYMANRGIDTLDAGTPVLAMHSPYEMVSKLDCWMTYKGMKAIYADQ